MGNTLVLPRHGYKGMHGVGRVGHLVPTAPPLLGPMLDNSVQNLKLVRATHKYSVTSECTALLSQKLGFRGVLDSGFSSCAAPTYYCGSEYFYNQHPQVRNLIGTEHSLNRSECRVKSKAS